MKKLQHLLDKLLYDPELLTCIENIYREHGLLPRKQLSLLEMLEFISTMNRDELKKVLEHANSLLNRVPVEENTVTPQLADNTAQAIPLLHPEASPLLAITTALEEVLDSVPLADTYVETRSQPEPNSEKALSEELASDTQGLEASVMEEVSPAQQETLGDVFDQILEEVTVVPTAADGLEDSLGKRKRTDDATLQDQQEETEN
jgi:hypothetical protein